MPATPRQRLASELLGVAIGLGALAAVWAVAVDSAPQVHADEVPQAPRAVEPTRSVTPVAGPLTSIFDVVPVDLDRYHVVPFDPGKNGENIGRATSSTATRATRTAAPPPATASPTPPPSATPPAPPASDPLTDDGTFGDGCEQPGTPERCDPKPNDPLPDDGEFGDGCETPGTPERCDPVVGLPPVIVEEEPSEEETPVDEVEVVETGTEVSG